MPSNRRQFLAGVSTASLVGIAGCRAFGRSHPDVNPATGLDQNTSQALDDEAVYVAGNDSDLPEPATTAESSGDADAILATATADKTILTRALRAGKPVAVAGRNATAAIRDLLTRVEADYSSGLEMVRARPVKIVVVVPHGATVETYTFIAEGGWKDPILDPFGWALTGRVPDCDTAVPESSSDEAFEYAGATHIVGHLSTGETYVSRSKASVNHQDNGRFVRLRTQLHAAANDGYAVEEAVRETDFPDDKRLAEVYPNTHTQNGVQIANVSDTTRSTFAIEVSPDSERTRRALTGCGGLRTSGRLAYDHRTSFRWKRDRLLSTDRHYGSATGRGEWVLNT